MPRIPMILQEDTTTISVEELDRAKPIPEDRRRALVAKMLGREPNSPAAPSLPKRPKREDFETDEGFGEALGFYKHQMPRRYKASPAK